MNDGLWILLILIQMIIDQVWISRLNLRLRKLEDKFGGRNG